MADQLPAIFKQSANLPAHLMEDDGDKNIIARASVNALTFEGKVWAISLDGKKTKLMKTDADGEEQPVQIFTGIVLDYNKARGRMFYTGPYDPKNPRIPDCWSEDSVKPHANVPGETQTLPLAIYAALQTPGGDAEALKLSLLSFAIAVVALVVSEWLGRRAQRLAGR